MKIKSYLGPTRYKERHPKATTGLNIGAGLTFVGAGLSIALLEQRNDLVK